MLDHLHDPLHQHFTSDMLEAVNLQLEMCLQSMTKIACEDAANEKLDDLPDSAFADSNGIQRYFPIHTPEHIALSRAYLYKYADEVDRRKVADILEDAASAFGLAAWEPGFIKVAQEDPIDELHQLAVDMKEFSDKYKQLTVDERAKTAQCLYARAESMDKVASLPAIAVAYSQRYLRPDYARAFDDRRRYFHERSPERTWLLQKSLDAKSMAVGDLVRALCNFDDRHGLSAYYDNALLDPYLALLGGPPPPDAPAWSGDGFEVMTSDLEPSNLKERLGDLVSDNILKTLHCAFGDSIEKMNPNLKIIVLRKLTQRC